MSKWSHLNYDLRSEIERGLNQSLSLSQIASLINKDDRTISKEIKKHRIFKDNSGKRKFLNREYSKFNDDCIKLNRYPYVCNGCARYKYCTNDFYIYDASKAQKEYKTILRESRKGVDLTKEELLVIDKAIKVGTSNGISIDNICKTNHNINKSTRTIYNYVHSGILSTKPVDLRRSVKMKPRSKTLKNNKKNILKLIYKDREIDDYFKYISDNLINTPVQMDTVIGRKGEGKCLLTLHFVPFHFMFVFLLENKDSYEVEKVFNYIEKRIGLDNFKKLFKVILTDRGCEFIEADRIEKSITKANELRTKLFYCDAYKSNEKAQIERNHELIRYILPKGTSFNKLNHKHAILIADEINSYPRKELGYRTPYDLMVAYYGEEEISRLYIEKIEPEQLNLSPTLLII